MLGIVKVIKFKHYKEIKRKISPYLLPAFAASLQISSDRSMASI